MSDRAPHTLFQALRRVWCRLTGHEEDYFESVPRGGYFVCFRCKKERPE